MKVVNVLICLVILAFQGTAHPYTVFKENGKVGLKNDAGRVIIPAQYENIGWSNGKFSVINNVTGCKSGDLWGLINLNNQRVTKIEFEELILSESEIVIARKKSPGSVRPLAGGISVAGKEVIPFSYDGIIISSLRAIVFTKIGNQFKYGLIDLANKTLIPQQYQEIRPVGTLRYGVRNFEGKLALFTEGGKQISDFSIDSISPFRKNYAILFEGRHQGLIDRNGQIVLAPKYREIQIDAEGKIYARLPDSWSFLNGSNDLIKNIHADSVCSIAPGLHKIGTAGQVQITDEKFVSVVQGVFSHVGRFTNGRARYDLKNLSGVIQLDGTVIVPALYSAITIGKGYILADAGLGKKNSWILFDSTGVRKTVKAYQSISPLANGSFAVRDKGFYGLIDSQGKEIVKNIYDSLLDFRDNYIHVKFQGLNGVIDTKERWVVTPRENQIKLLGKEKFLEFAPSSITLKSMNGSVIYFTSNKLVAFDDYLLEFLPGGNVWKIDLNGVIIDRQLSPSEPTEAIYQESEGLRAIKRNGRFGFIDGKGRLRIANRYEAVQPFKEGYSAVKILGKWGFINMQDNLTVQPVYDEVQPFQNGRALVKQKGLCGMIDVKGFLILPVRYENIEKLETGNMIIQLNKMRGLVDGSGKVLITPRYDWLADTGKGYVIVRKDQKYGVLSFTGVNTIPTMYDLIEYDRHSDLFIALKKTPWVKIDL